MGEIRENLAVDFRLKLDPRTEEDVEYSFRFGKCQDFKFALSKVKEIAFLDRDYNPEDDHLWTVQASESNLSILCEAFNNFRSMYVATKGQKRLPLF